MKVLLRVVSVVMWLVAAFLIYAVIHAMASAGGARAGVAVGYVAGAIVLTARRRLAVARAQRQAQGAGSGVAADSWLRPRRRGGFVSRARSSPWHETVWSS